LSKSWHTFWIALFINGLFFWVNLLY